MILWILLGIHTPFYIRSWRFIFKKITYWYVVKPREVGKGTKIQQFEPDWSDVGYGIVGATLLSFLWPLIAMVALCTFIMARYRPVVVAEKLGGKMPPEARKALLEYKTKELEREVEMHYDPNVAIKGEIV